MSAEIVGLDVLDASSLQVVDVSGLLLIGPPPAGDAGVQFVQVGLELVLPVVPWHLNEPTAMFGVGVTLGLQLAASDVFPNVPLRDVQAAGRILNRKFFHWDSVGPSQGPAWAPPRSPRPKPWPGPRWYRPESRPGGPWGRHLWLSLPRTRSGTARRGPGPGGGPAERLRIP